LFEKYNFPDKIKNSSYIDLEVSSRCTGVEMEFKYRFCSASSRVETRLAVSCSFSSFRSELKIIEYLKKGI